MATFVLEVLDAAEAAAVSEAWWTRMNISLTATPTYAVASEGANETVSVDSGDVPVMLSMALVIVPSPMVHVPYTLPTSLWGKITLQPLVGVKTELGSVE